MKGQKMDLFGKRARDERIRKEAAAATRAELASALADLPPFIIKSVASWHQSLAAGTRQAVNQWFATRVANQTAALRRRASRRMKSLAGQISVATVQKLAEEQRRELINTIGAQGGILFATSMRRRSAEMLLAVQRAVEKSNGAVSSGEDALPNGTRFFFRNADGSRLYVIEQPPTVRTVRIAGYGPSDAYRSYRLAFPFLVFLVRFNNAGDPCGLFAFFRNERLRDMQDTLYIPALPNIDSNYCRVCFPDLERSERNLPITEKVERILDSFWGSGFNEDFPSHFVSSMERINEISSIERWQENAAKNPQFVLKLHWLPFEQGTLAATISQLCRSDQESDDSCLANVSEIINRIAERVAQDVAESVLQLIPGWKIEDTPAQALVAELNQLLSEGAESLKSMVAKSAQEIFSQMPNVDHTTAESERLWAGINRAIDEQIRWIGLVPKVPHTDQT